MYDYDYRPESEESRLSNLNLAFRYIAELGDVEHSTRPMELLKGDLKSVLRILFALFKKYKKRKEE